MDKIMDLVKGQIGKIVSAEEAVPTGKADQIADAASSSLLNELKKQATPDNIPALMSLMGGNGGGAGSAIQKGIESVVSSTLVSKVKLDKGLANKLSGLIVPAVMSLLGKESQSGGLDIGTLLGSLGGGSKSGGGLMGMLGGLGSLFGKK